MKISRLTHLRPWLKNIIRLRRTASEGLYFWWNSGSGDIKSDGSIDYSSTVDLPVVMGDACGETNEWHFVPN